ncbi:MAG: FAD-dependent oxidoreductase [Candidatus Acidiferrales bacterium]
MTTRAVVIGGSIAGLLAARVLSEHFESVTIVDRDQPPAAPEPRKGVPQGKHGHGLLAAGSAVMDALFPGMFEEMVAGGAVKADAAEEIWWFNNGAWRAQTRSGLVGYLQSRPFLEFHIRKRVLQLPRVTEECGCTAAGLQFDDTRRHVIGVRVSHDQAPPEVIPADLVVDCSGRGSQLPAWLEAAGWPRPPVSRVEVNVGYSTRILRLQDGQPGWKALLILGHPPKHSRLGVMFPVEGHWMVTLGGEFRDYPPDDEQGFAEFARSLYHPELYEKLRAGVPVTPIVTFRFPAHVWNHYERLQLWPQGLLAMGDGVCSFNPIYGQGMTLAALEAQVLQRCLAEQRGAGNRDGQALSHAYYKGIAAPVSAAWAMSTGADLAYPEAEGQRTRAGAWMGRYLEHVIAMTCYDPHVLKEWVFVTHMVKPISAVFHPRIAARVLRRVISGGPPLPTDQPRRI